MTSEWIDERTHRPTLLVLRALGLGDFLTGVPAYRALRRRFPAHRVVLAAPGYLAVLAPLTRAIDEVLPHEGLGPIRWEGPPPDIAVNLHGRGPESHEMLADLHPRRLLAFQQRDAVGQRGWPDWRDGEHEVTRWCRMLAGFGVVADPADLELDPPGVDSPAPGAVVVHPGTRYGAKRWPSERFAVVAARLAQEGQRVVVSGADTEIDLVREVADRAGLDGQAVLAGRTDLAKLAALVASARLVVANDTGIGHLATSYGTPSVLLFGPVSPRYWGPPPHREEHVALWHPGPSNGAGADPREEAPDPSMLAISVAEVLVAVRGLLEAEEWRAEDMPRRAARAPDPEPPPPLDDDHDVEQTIDLGISSLDAFRSYTVRTRSFRLFGRAVTITERW